MKRGEKYGCESKAKKSSVSEEKEGERERERGLFWGSGRDDCLDGVISGSSMSAYNNNNTFSNFIFFIIKSFNNILF